MSDDPGFEYELRQLINKYSKERGSDTPDHILADYLVHCLNAFDIAVSKRTKRHKNQVLSDIINTAKERDEYNRRLYGK